MTSKGDELRTLETDELVSRLREAKDELFKLRFQYASGQLESHGRLSAVRKDIARIYTVMREIELGITVKEENTEGAA
ncbi:MAG TPA: 50S ribosomal protein L29 [Acidothermaceae bacterium]|jgi:large subunit ribosomal protein L29|nr:50S ribosomal protein L29 [Acidothermaceae bacterium]